MAGASRAEGVHVLRSQEGSMPEGSRTMAEGRQGQLGALLRKLGLHPESTWAHSVIPFAFFLF